MPRRSPVPALWIAFVLLFGAGLTGCGGTSGTEAEPVDVASPLAPAAPTAPATVPAPPAAAVDSVAVTETEMSIGLSVKTLKAGTYTFVTKNGGSITHALTIDGPGVGDLSSGSIDPGASKSLTAKLTAGSYELYCPVGNHKAAGMVMHLTVT